MVLLIQVGHEEQKIFYKKLSWLKDLKIQRFSIMSLKKCDGNVAGGGKSAWKVQTLH